MERWSGRVAVVTGASAGIGYALAELLVKKGMKVVGLARRADNIQELANKLEGEPGKLYAVKTDVSKEEDILQAFKWLKDNLGGVDVLVNNAAVAPYNMLSDSNTSEWRKTLDLNVLGLSICTREALKSMKERGVNDGHIIHINSILGHYIPNLPECYMYAASKHAVTALTEGLRKELVQLNTNIRVTSISPGTVDTAMLRDSKLPAELLVDMPKMQPVDIADAVVYALSVPARVQNLQGSNTSMCPPYCYTGYEQRRVLRVFLIIAGTILPPLESDTIRQADFPYKVSPGLIPSTTFFPPSSRFSSPLSPSLAECSILQTVKKQLQALTSSKIPRDTDL